jgi:L-threonylcarbamoyladenylate synthase
MIKIKVEELIKLSKIDIIGKVIVFPTDTVYGVGALYNDLEGIKKIYDLKHRDKTKPLACLAAYTEDILPLVNINNNRSEELMNYWPGALTLIFEKKNKKLIDENLSTIAFRIPNSKVALKVLSHFGIMAVTSMNISGSKPLNDLKSIEENFSETIDYLVIDDEELSEVSSTIIDISTEDIKVLRKGDLLEKINV